MANENRKNQNNVSADHKMINEKKDNNTVKESSKNSFDVSVLWELIKKYKRYIAAGALFVAMVVILTKCTGPVTDAPKEPVADEQTADNVEQTEEFQDRKSVV